MFYIVIFTFLFILLGTKNASSTPITIQAGQCIMVGSQEVCAQKSSEAPATSASSEFTCVYGKHAGNDSGDLKSYAVVKTSVHSNGQKTEQTLKNYGINGKTECENDAEKREARDQAKSK